MKHIIAAIIIITTSTMVSAQTFYDFTMESIDGEQIELSQYKGKVVLVVNVASFCGFTYQYEPLEQLYQKYKDKGLVILGFPSNDFGAQEPGTSEEIKEFCESNYHITFPMFSKITVKGDGQHPLYAWLVSGGGNESLAGEVMWNFEKFLIDRNGDVVKRYRRAEEPLGETMIADIEAALNS